MNICYPSGLEAFATAQIDLSAGKLVAYIVNADYTFNKAHQSLSDLVGILGGAVLRNVSYVGGIIDADDLVVVAPSDGIVHSVVVAYFNNGTDSPPIDITQIKLLVFIDTGDGLNIDPEGPALIVWNNVSVKKILALGGAS